jgi:DNA-binding LytR/AlgR family response regulator
LTVFSKTKSPERNTPWECSTSRGVLRSLSAVQNRLAFSILFVIMEQKVGDSMLRIAIVEDNPTASATLQGYVQRYCQEHPEVGDYQITVFPDGLDIVEDYHPIWDLILMDIEMPHMDGMDAARRIRAVDPAVVLIFVTNMARYAIRGYEVDATDFLLKPVKYAHFSLKLHKAMTLIRSRERRFLMVNVEGRNVRIATDDILFVEVLNHQLQFYTADATYTTRGTLQELESQLAGLPFARCSKSYLVNLRNVVCVWKETVQLPGHELTITRTKRKEFLQRLSEYMGGGGRSSC